MKNVNVFSLCATLGLGTLGNIKHAFYFIKDFYVISGDFPCCNIELISEGQCCLSLVVVGFLKHELKVFVQSNILIVSGCDTSDMRNKHYLYRGVMKCDFKYKFILLEGMKVLSVILKSGLLNIYIQYCFQNRNIVKSRHIEIVCN